MEVLLDKKRIKSLNFSFNNIKNPSIILKSLYTSHHTEIESINLSNNSISNLSNVEHYLRGLKNLKELNLSLNTFLFN